LLLLYYSSVVSYFDYSW